MAAAFSQEEREQIDAALQKAAENCAVTVGMKKTTVEQLAQAAGISKGAFYKFYACKELLFLRVLEGLHTQMYGSAMRVLEESSGLDKRERVALALKRALGELESHRMIAFIQGDLPALLRKLPKQVLREHYHSDTEHIRALLEKSGTALRCPLDTACTAAMLLLFSLSCKPMFGAVSYDDAIDLLIDGACERMIEA